MAGTADQMISEIEAFADEGVTLLVVVFGETDPEKAVALVEAFDRDVVRVLAQRPERTRTEAIAPIPG